MPEGHWEHRETNPTTDKEYFDWKKEPKKRRSKKTPITPTIPSQSIPYVRGRYNADLVAQGMEERENKKEVPPTPIPSKKTQK
jgi:hypothetical protein